MTFSLSNSGYTGSSLAAIGGYAPPMIGGSAGGGGYSNLGLGAAPAAPLSSPIGLPSATLSGRVKTIQPVGPGTWVEDYLGSIPSAVGGTIAGYWSSGVTDATKVATSGVDGVQTIASDAVGLAKSAASKVDSVAGSIGSGAEAAVKGFAGTVTGFGGAIQADVQGVLGVIPWIVVLGIAAVGVYFYATLKPK